MANALKREPIVGVLEREHFKRYDTTNAETSLSIGITLYGISSCGQNVDVHLIHTCSDARSWRKGAYQSLRSTSFTRNGWCGEECGELEQILVKMSSVKG